MDLSTSLIVGFFGSFLLLGVLTLTSFVKISVVLMILRNAIGLQQVPSNMVVMVIALFLSLFITAPVFSSALAAVSGVNLTDGSVADILVAVELALGPFQRFIAENTSIEQTDFFLGISQNVWEGSGFSADSDSVIIQVPAFLISELTHAFEMGFLLYLPFIAIDLAVTILLMAMGMQQVQPSLISTPFKLLLFISLDGWSKLIEGLVTGYWTGG